MTKILIADDEPLVQAGIRSMLRWEELGYEIVGVASNGAAAYEMILKYSPDIVITDIKMPVMSGLKLAQKCYEEHRGLPIFIILTSYEEFQLVKEALRYHVSDYLVKLELTPASLLDALKKAESDLPKAENSNPVTDSASERLSQLTNQFYIRLLLNLHENRQQIDQQAARLNIQFESASYSVCYAEITSSKISSLDLEQTLSLYASSLQMVRELISRYLPCYVLSLDTRFFCIIFFFETDDTEKCKELIRSCFGQISPMLYNYYSVKLLLSFGSLVTDPMLLSTSYREAKLAFSYLNDESPMIYAPAALNSDNMKESFNFSLFREDIRKAFAEYDARSFGDIIDTIVDLFQSHPTHFVQALDAAASILYMTLNLLNNSEQILCDIYKDHPYGYRSLYELSSTTQIITYLITLKNGICSVLSAHVKDYKNHIVQNVKKYIHDHIREKLSLNSLSESFNISPSYLSSLFSKYNDMGFIDYVNQQKIEYAQEMLSSGKYKIYEVSDMMGFENSFYFSRVFKKVTGMSPRDYLNNLE